MTGFAAALHELASRPESLHVVFPTERRPHQAALLRTLGVEWSVRPDPQTPRVPSIPAHDIAQTRVCVEDSCTGDASDAPRRGPFANRCEPHREKVRQRMRAGREAAGPRKPLGSRPAGSGATPSPPAPIEKPERPKTLVEATAALHGSAKGLEDKVARRREARDAAKAALAAFNDALNVVKQTAEQLLGA